MNHTTHPASRYGKPGVGLLLLASLWFGASFNPALAGDNNHWQRIAERIDSQVTQAVDHYRQGDAVAARSAVVKAYFSEFEDSKMEAAMRMELGAKPTWELEQMFGQLRKAIKQEQDADQVAALGDEIRSTVDSGALALDKAGITPDVFEVNQ